MYLLIIFENKEITIVGESQIHKADKKSTKKLVPGDAVQVTKGPVQGTAKIIHVSSKYNFSIKYVINDDCDEN